MRAERLFLITSVLVSACQFDTRGLSLTQGDGAVLPPDSPDAGTDPIGRADAAIAPSPALAAIWLSTADGLEQLARQPDLPLAAVPQLRPAVTVAIDEASVLQEIDGFGATLTESSAWLLATRMSPAQRHALLVQLFDREQGIGLGILRLPIGATDFALSNYSYDDSGPPLDDFSIEHERSWMLPVLHEIQAINPGLRRIAAPWSPPAWMKTSSSMVGGALRPARRAVLARYLADYVDAYAAEGLPIEAISVQNEPYNLPAASPGMYMEWSEQATIIKNLLGPELAARGLDTGILVWDHNWDNSTYAEQVLADADARAFVTGTAFHCYGGDASAQDRIHELHPELGIWMTECGGATWIGGYGDNLVNDASVLIASTRHWARGVLKWNLALDEAHGPQNHGCEECLGTVEIQSASGEVTLNAEYFALGHAAKFVAPGAHRVGSATLGQSVLEHVAFLNADDSLVVVVLNPGAAEAGFELDTGRGKLAYSLPAGAVATFYLGGTPPQEL